MKIKINKNKLINTKSLSLLILIITSFLLYNFYNYNNPDIIESLSARGGSRGTTHQSGGGSHTSRCGSSKKSIFCRCNSSWQCLSGTCYNNICARRCKNNGKKEPGCICENTSECISGSKCSKNICQDIDYLLIAGKGIFKGLKEMAKYIKNEIKNAIN